MFRDVQKEYFDAIFDTDGERALTAVQTAHNSGISAEEIVFNIVIPSLEKFLDYAAAKDISLAQHYLASQIAADVVDSMIPLFITAPEPIGKVVIGTSHGDFHGLGKRVVAGCLKAKMIDVVDLGLNVPADKFVQSALDNNAGIIGISSMMLHTAAGENACSAVRRILKSKGLEDKIKIIVGGAPYLFDENLYIRVGADAWAPNGLAAAETIAGLIREAIL
jgi:methylmalonyl-CoA mutase cobalamin-binding domain/chain